MPYLLPDDTTPTAFKCLTIRIPDDPQWESTFWGNMLQLCRWFNFDRDEAHNGTVVAKVWCELIEEAMSCNTITAIRTNNGWLEVQFCNSSMWVQISKIMTGGIRYVNGAVQYDFDGDGVYEVTQYTNSYENIFGTGLPTADDADKICRASWQLARSLCDDFADLINLFNLGTKIISSAAQSVIDFFPASFFADDIVEFATEDLPVSVMTYIVTSAKDPDTIEKVAQMIYCSIVEHYPGDLDDVIEDIPLGIYHPIFEPDEILKITKWLNFEDIAQSIYDSLTGDAVAYMVIGFARTTLIQLRTFVGMAKPTEIFILGALSTAIYSDARDCIDFDCAPCINTTLNLKASQACTVAREGSCTEDNNSEYAVWTLNAGWGPMTCSTGTDPADGRYRRMQVYLELGETVTITSVRWKWSGDAVLQNDLLNATASDSGTIIVAESLTAGEYFWSGSISGVSRLLFILERNGTVASPPSGNWRLEEIAVTTE